MSPSLQIETNVALSDDKQKTSPSAITTTTGAKVWVEDKEEGFIEGHVLEEKSDAVLIQLPDGSSQTIARSSVQWMNPPKYQFASDLADLTYLNEGSVLYNLKHRYFNNMIYASSPRRSRSFSCPVLTFFMIDLLWAVFDSSQSLQVAADLWTKRSGHVSKQETQRK